MGYGTRHAAKTVAAMVEAAAAPGPSVTSAAASEVHAGARTGASTSRAEVLPPPAEARAVRTVPPVSKGQAKAGLGLGVQRFRKSFWGPLAVFSGALWLRVTGLFFALIACTLGSGAWRLRTHPGVVAGGFHPLPRFWVFVVFAALFTYFALSSFVRASLKERRAIRS